MSIVCESGCDGVNVGFLKKHTITENSILKPIYFYDGYISLIDVGELQLPKPRDLFHDIDDDNTYQPSSGNFFECFIVNNGCKFCKIIGNDGVRIYGDGLLEPHGVMRLVFYFSKCSAFKGVELDVIIFKN